MSQIASAFLNFGGEGESREPKKSEENHKLSLAFLNFGRRRRVMDLEPKKRGGESQIVSGLSKSGRRN